MSVFNPPILASPPAEPFWRSSVAGGSRADPQRIEGTLVDPGVATPEDAAPKLRGDGVIDDAQGVLAIWNDIRDGRTDEFESWFKNEHFQERLAVPGFRLGRRYEAISGSPRYFCCYLTDPPDILTSPAYLERLNNPTPLTRSVMTHGFVNMNRTACLRARRFGSLWGALSVTARFDQPLAASRVSKLLEKMAGEDGIARCELWTARESGRDIAVEERLRGGDRKIVACIVVDALREADADRARSALLREFGDAANTGVYRLLCAITRSDGA